jgi:hypothetical protein
MRLGRERPASVATFPVGGQWVAHAVSVFFCAEFVLPSASVFNVRTRKGSAVTQYELIHETIYEAMSDAVRALGGAKKVGPELWKALPQKSAENRVNDCLNPNRNDKFSLPEMLWIIRSARAVGYHGAMAFIAQESGYRVEPIEPLDERDALQREYIESVKAAQKIAARLERLAIAPNMKAVA